MNHKKLEDAIKDLTKKVKDIVATFHVELSDSSFVEGINVGYWEQFAKGWSLKAKEKVKIFEPRLYIEERDAKKLENFVFNMDKYFPSS